MLYFLTLVLFNNLAQARQTTTRWDEAEPLMRRALRRFSRKTGHRYLQLEIAIQNYSLLLAELKLPKEEILSLVSEASGLSIEDLRDDFDLTE